MRSTVATRRSQLQRLSVAELAGEPDHVARQVDPARAAGRVEESRVNWRSPSHGLGSGERAGVEQLGSHTLLCAPRWIGVPARGSPTDSHP